MSATTFLRSRSASPTHYDSDDEPKQFGRYLRHESTEKFRFFRRISRFRCLAASVILFALFGYLITMGPLQSSYQNSKCQAAIYIAGAPKAQSNWTSSSANYISPHEETSKWAKQLHPEELMDMLERGESFGSKIIHQSWKTRNDVPTNFEIWGREWRRLHGSDWRYAPALISTDLT